MNGMGRYHFHTAGQDEHIDREGVDLPNVHAAKRYAMRYAGEVLTLASETWPGGPSQVTVTDSAGAPLFRIVTEIVDERVITPAND